MAKDEKKTTEEQCCEQADPREAKAKSDASLMLTCFRLAVELMEKPEVVPGPVVLRSEMPAKIALDLFASSTRAVPDSAGVFTKAIEYLTLLTEDKAAEVKRSEELRDSVPFMPTFGIARDRSAMCKHPEASEPCKHVGLRSLYGRLKSESVGSYTRKVLMSVVEDLSSPLTVSESLELADAPAGEIWSITFLRCRDCLTTISTEAFLSGEAWTEETEEENEEEKAKKRDV